MRIRTALASLAALASLLGCEASEAPPSEDDRTPCVVMSAEGEVIAGRFVPTVMRYGCGGCVGKQREQALDWCPSTF